MNLMIALSKASGIALEMSIKSVLEVAESQLMALDLLIKVIAEVLF